MVPFDFNFLSDHKLNQPRHMEKYRKKFNLTASQSPSGIGLLVIVIAIMWVTEIVDTVLGGRLDSNGIIPRSIAGIDGILWWPFLHGGFSHLISNTVCWSGRSRSDQTSYTSALRVGSLGCSDSWSYQQSLNGNCCRSALAWSPSSFTAARSCSASFLDPVSRGRGTCLASSRESLLPEYLQIAK